MTLFKPDLLKPPGRLLLQYDTWEVVSCGVPQNVSSQPSQRKPFQAEFRASEFDKTIYNMLQCIQMCACYVGSGRTAITCKGETSAGVDHCRREWAVEKQGGL